LYFNLMTENRKELTYPGSVIKPLQVKRLIKESNAMSPTMSDTHRILQSKFRNTSNLSNSLFFDVEETDTNQTQGNLSNSVQKEQEDDIKELNDFESFDSEDSNTISPSNNPIQESENSIRYESIKIADTPNKLAKGNLNSHSEQEFDRKQKPLPHLNDCPKQETRNENLDKCTRQMNFQVPSPLRNRRLSPLFLNTTAEIARISDQNFDQSSKILATKNVQHEENTYVVSLVQKQVDPSIHIKAKIFQLSMIDPQKRSERTVNLSDQKDIEMCQTNETDYDSLLHQLILEKDLFSNSQNSGKELVYKTEKNVEGEIVSVDIYVSDNPKGILCKILNKFEKIENERFIAWMN